MRVQVITEFYDRRPNRFLCFDNGQIPVFIIVNYTCYAQLGSIQRHCYTGGCVLHNMIVGKNQIISNNDTAALAQIRHNKHDALIISRYDLIRRQLDQVLLICLKPFLIFRFGSGIPFDGGIKRFGYEADRHKGHSAANDWRFIEINRFAIDDGLLLSYY
ncbi:hypothetical protein D3C80_1388380 [compost metagenome]